MRQNIIIFHYQIATARENKRSIRDTLKTALPDMQQFRSIVDNIKAKSRERKALTAEKSGLSPIHIVMIRELTQRITAITEEISELQSQKVFLLSKYSCVDDADMEKQAKEMEASLQRLEKQETQFRQELGKELVHYGELSERASTLDAAKLSAARDVLRSGKNKATAEKLQSVYGERFSDTRLQRARENAATMLSEKVPEQQIRQYIRARLEKNRQQLSQKQAQHHRDSDERER